MTLKLDHTTITILEKCGTWLHTSDILMSDIEQESLPTLIQLRKVGLEWAGTLSRLVKRH